MKSTTAPLAIHIMRIFRFSSSSWFVIDPSLFRMNNGAWWGVFRPVRQSGRGPRMKIRFTGCARHWHPYGQGSCAQPQLNGPASGRFPWTATGAANTVATPTTAVTTTATSNKPTRPAASLYMDIGTPIRPGRQWLHNRGAVAKAPRPYRGPVGTDSSLFWRDCGPLGGA
jgi:hypothetical protein